MKSEQVKLHKAGIVIDKWKLEIFERHLSEYGYSYDKGPGVTPDSLLITVETTNLHALEVVVRSANTEAAKTGAPK